MTKLLLTVVLISVWQAAAQDANNPYPTSMAPLDQHLHGPQ